MPVKRPLVAATLLLFLACARHPVTAPRVQPAGWASTSTPAPAPSAARAPVPAATADSPAPVEDGLETQCNGLDDDGDSLVDVLLPTGSNACRTSLPGACAAGFAACQGGKRVCLGAAPMPEVLDGIDNDCNGVVDDVPTATVHPRVLVLAPRYAWEDATLDIDTLTSVLAQAGIPYDVQKTGTEWDTVLPNLGRYTMAVVPGYLEGDAVMPEARQSLEEFASKGGVVVVFKPVGPAAFPQAWMLAGLRSSTKHTDVLEIRFDGIRPPPVSSFDSPEELALVINDPSTPAGQRPEDFWLDPDPAAGTEVIAHGYTASESGATVTRRAIGAGAVYALGHDLATYGTERCYVNCFEPEGDVLRLFLEGAFRESAKGHIVVKHTAPGEASSVLIVSHDVDAPDADNEGPWGPPGALQMAQLERDRGIRATYNITTDYVAGYYNAQTMKGLCDLGMCPLGAHSVTHSLGFADFPEGTCTEKREGFGAHRTVCGEIHISRDMVGEVMGHPPRVWRSPYLAVPARLAPLLARNGFAYDSSYAIGDLPYNLPIDLSTVGYHQERFEHAKLIEFPISCEDGFVEKGLGPTHRVELQASTRSRFASLWRYTLLRNAQNRSTTTLLLHPSRGRDQPWDNLQLKIDVLASYLKDALGYDVIVRPMEEMGDFWRARLDSTLDASFETDGGYTGTLTIGATSAPGLTLEFGDAIKNFTCAECGKTKIHGKRVVLLDAVPPRTKATFVAEIR